MPDAALAAWHVAAHLLGGVAQIRGDFPRLSRDERHERVQAWAREMLKRLRVELEVVGAPARSGPMLLVANHVSWLDIVALHATCHCRFVAKSDVKRWPLIGALASGGDTLYVERRSRRDARRIVDEMARALRDRHIVAVFPEGTTGDGAAVLPFHGNLIQAAISADAPAQPVALRFAERGSPAPSRAVRYAAEDSLVGSIWRTLRARGLRARLAFGAPQRAAGRDRRAWASDLRAQIAAMLD